MNKDIQAALEEVKAASAKFLKLREVAIKELADEIAALDVKPEELGFRSKEEEEVEIEEKKKVEAKYINALTGEKWTGRGREPKWIGGEREKYLIEK